MAGWFKRRRQHALKAAATRKVERRGPVFERLEERIMLSAAASWTNVPIGGGGFVPGIIYNQSEPNLVYARTDVGGAYRWNPVNSTWTPITDSINAPGVLSLATDPVNPNRVYIAAGLYTAWWAQDASIYYSTDQGNSWTQVALPFKLGGNEDGRGAGERLQIDPNNDSILYLGTNDNGLWKSTDYGQTWSQVTSFSPSSVTFVLFNKASGSSGNTTPDIYVGVNSTTGPNLYESTDAGATWAPVANEPAAGLLAYRAEIDSAGNMYISYDNALGPNDVSSGAVWKLDTQNGAWTNITPPTGQGGFAGVAVDAENPGTIMVTTLDRWWPNGDQIYRSTDGGATWTDLMGSITYNYSNSPYQSGTFVAWLADIEINPFNPNNAMFVTGSGIWASNNVTSADTGGGTTWGFQDNGLEEMVPLGMIAPPSGSPLLSTMGDISGFNFTTLTSSPAAGTFSPTMGTNTGIDFAQNNPATIVRVGYNSPYGAYSTDGGVSWTGFASVPAGASSSGPGEIAISANGNTIVWSPNSSGTYYSTNDGASWNASSGAPSSSGNSFTPISDRSNSNYFYIYDQLNGTLYVSSNGGVSFNAAASGLPTYGSGLKATPGYAGDLWLDAGSGGLYHSTNYGASFTQDGSVQQAFLVAFGKPLSGSYPALYLWGVVNNTTGIFVSNDGGTTWTQIDTAGEPFGNSNSPQGVNTMVASPNIYGQIYVGGGARGVFVGNIMPSGWSDQDIGGPASTGSAAYDSNNGQWTVSGGGSDIWGSSDQFNFASTSWYGSGTLTAQVTSVQNTNSWAKAGVMFRDSNNAGSMFVDVLATPGNGVTMQWRNATGGQCNYTAIYGINGPVWVQLIRNGNTFSGYYSTNNGSTWNLITTTTVAFSDTVNLAGLAVTSHDNSTLNTSTFSNVSLAANTLPSGWLISAESMKTQGSAGTFGINLPLTGTPGVEDRIGGPTRIVFTFQTPIATGANFAVGLSSGTVSSTQVSGNTLTVNLSGATQGQMLTVNVNDVEDATNGASGNYSVQVGVLYGDVTGNGLVNVADINAVRKASGDAVNSTDFRDDLNCNGLINVADINIVRQLSGTSLSASSALQPAVASAQLQIPIAISQNGSNTPAAQTTESTSTNATETGAGTATLNMTGLTINGSGSTGARGVSGAFVLLPRAVATAGTPIDALVTAPELSQAETALDMSTGGLASSGWGATLLGGNRGRYVPRSGSDTQTVASDVAKPTVGGNADTRISAEVLALLPPAAVAAAPTAITAGVEAPELGTWLTALGTPIGDQAGPWWKASLIDIHWE